MAGHIFISYRRSDEPGFAKALFNELESAFLPGHLFMDVDNIRPGEDFVKALSDYLQQCQVVLVVIGPQWLHITNRAGKRRLDDPLDFVRLEIETAIALGKTIIPVLANGASMPSADELPRKMARLSRFQAVRVDQERFGSDVEFLLQQLDVALNSAKIPVVAIQAKSERSAPANAPAEARSGSTPSLFSDRLSLGLLGLTVVAFLLVVLFAGRPPPPLPPINEAATLDAISFASRPAEPLAVSQIARAAATIDDLLVLVERRARDRREPPALPPELPARRSFAASAGAVPPPVRGKVIQSFGERTTSGRLSRGEVIEVSARSGVQSPADGWVVFADDFRSFGPLFIADVGDGYHVVMAGFSWIDVAVGQYVFAGQNVGRVAASGKAESALLYLEILKDRKPVNPSIWIKRPS